MKLITFAVPCYNSEQYMRKCVDSLLHAGDRAEIIIINDGSKDSTKDICDEYVRDYPTIVRAIHQENGGHGEGVNQGLRHATGLYYKVVDSDDWADRKAMEKVMEKLEEFSKMPEPVDLLVCNYVYEHVEDGTSKPMRYPNVFPEGKIVGWEDTGKFKISQYLLMHSVFCRTQVLKDSGMCLPKHTFYVDNLFVHHALPYMKTIVYLNQDFYRYYIGRSDQSVNQDVMIKRINQQLKVTKLMIEAHDLSKVAKTSRKLSLYMSNYLSMMISITTILSLLSKDKANAGVRREMWAHVKKYNPKSYNRLRHFSLAAFASQPGFIGKKTVVIAYKIMQRVYHFN